MVGGWGKQSEFKCMENCHSVKPRHCSVGCDTSWQQPRSQEGLVPGSQASEEDGSEKQGYRRLTHLICVWNMDFTASWLKDKTDTHRKSIPSAAPLQSEERTVFWADAISVLTIIINFIPPQAGCCLVQWKAHRNRVTGGYRGIHCWTTDFLSCPLCST